jgi:hypothetical protein
MSQLRYFTALPPSPPLQITRFSDLFSVLSTQIGPYQAIRFLNSPSFSCTQGTIRGKTGQLPANG